MGYRTISVETKVGVTKDYEYIIGKSHTKVKGLGVFENNLIGEDVPGDAFGRVRVTPALLSRAIKARVNGELIGELS